MGRMISVAVQKGGGDPNANPTLRYAIEKAKECRMPKENIDRAIKKALGVGGGERYEEVVYEGFGPSGVAYYVKALTDNKNRTVAEIRNIFERFGGSLGGKGSTAYIFADPENPTFEVKIEDANSARKVISLTDTLDDHDAVQEIYANFDLPEEFLS